MHKEWLAAASASVVTTNREVPRVRLPGRVLLLGVLLWAGPVRMLWAESAAEFVAQARQCDPSYAIGPQVSRTRAMELYEKALTAGITDPRQQLDVLFRMGQLQGCIFDPRKGEKPNLRKAIGFYQQIVESYPSEEPMVLKAIGLVSDHYTSLREFDAAVAWARRAVDYDTAKAEQRINDIERRQDSLATTRYSPDERREIMERAVRTAPLRDDLQQMKTARVAAVDRLASAARMLDPLREYGEMKAIADRYAGTPVGDRATRKLQEVMDRHADLWAPGLEPPRHPASTLQPAGVTPLILTRNRNQEGIAAPPGPGIDAIAEPNPPEPNTTAKPQEMIPLAKSPRAPPGVARSIALVVAAGLVVLGLAVRRIRNKTFARNPNHET
jgi:hypothetical protein